jgi:hypothetical protein
MKMIQNAVLRNGNRKYTTEKADKIEIRILPVAMPSAMMNEFSIMVPTGSRVVRAVPTNTVR